MSNPFKKIIYSTPIRLSSIFGKKHIKTISNIKLAPKLRNSAIRLDSPVMESIRADLINPK